MATRYLVDEVEVAVAFYVDQLGFDLVERWGSAFAIVRREDTTLWLSGPESSAARPMPDGRKPAPGGWNRVVIEVADIDVYVAGLQEVGVVFRSEPLIGPGGTQVLIDDPFGNPVELFEGR